MEKIDSLVGKIQIKLNEALNSITQKPVVLNLKHSGLIPIQQAEKLIETIPGQVTAIYIPIIDNVTGDIFVFLPVEMANNLADIMIGSPQGTTKILGDFESSALKEFGNITFGVIVTQIADALNITMMLTVPNLATGNANALLDQVLIEYGETATDMLAIQMPFSIEGISHEANFIVLFDKKSSDLISLKLDNTDPLYSSEERDLHNGNN